ncbi:MAG: hypothetical protein D6790_20265 [Caldilineae bacterium]|nr:MAG: hypothetical protein D6790_20265 [Caldilineae bacterium]
MWMITTYEPVSLITLKIATATSTGGKSLLLPTPFAFKMALLDVVIRSEGVAVAQGLWPRIRDGGVAIRGPAHIAVTNTFTKILKPNRNAGLDADTGLVSVMIRSIGFREYVQWQGAAQIAFQPNGNEDDSASWRRWLTQINYLGKRGGFVQAVDAPKAKDHLPDGFTLLTDEQTETFVMDGTLQLLDDCGPKLTFEQVNVYTNKGMKMGRDRILRTVVLPYRLERASRGYSLYTRVA